MNAKPEIRRCTHCIDIHTHIVPHYFPNYVGTSSNVRWPSMKEGSACHKHVMLEGKLFRTVAENAWNTSVRLDDMANEEVTKQVLSPMPELLSYWLSPQDGQQMARFLNEYISGMVQAQPERFYGLGTVALQDIDLAIAEVEYCVRKLGLRGVEIGSNVNGTAIGDDRFSSFFEACQELGAAVFVHPIRPSGTDRLIGPPALEQAIAFPGEVGLAAISLITSGRIQKLPKLKIAFSHGGGSFQVLLTRLRKAWTSIDSVREQMPGDPVELASKLYFDNLLYDAALTRSLIALVGSTQVMIGTDYPFAIRDNQPKQTLDSLGLSPEDMQRISHLNAERWLSI